MASYSLAFLNIFAIILLCKLSSALKNVENEVIEVRSFKQGHMSFVSKDRIKRDVPLSETIACIKTQSAVDQRIKDMTNESRKIFAEEVEFVGDNKFSLQMAWTGSDAEKIIVLTSENGISSCYLSDGTGKVFNNISARLDGATENHELSLQKHPMDSKTVYIVSNALLNTVSSLHNSIDGGNSFTKVDLPFRLVGNMIFHPSIWDLILASDESMDLYLSTDRGFKWKKIKSSILSVKWSTVTNSSDIFAVTGDGLMIFSDSHSNVLEKSEDLGNTWKKLYEHVHTFGLGGKFLYASAFMPELHSDERKLIVSTDAGNTWNHARLPSVTSDRFYSILDSTEGQIFLHVDHPGGVYSDNFSGRLYQDYKIELICAGSLQIEDTGRGTLYLSDATGIVFSESLNDHLYPNYEDLTDFYSVQSMRGVYIGSQLLSDNSIHTMITYNRGGEWQPIPRPEGLPCMDETKKCFLQIHNLYSIKRGIRANPPLSVPNAVGIILVHGHIAESLQVTDPDVYVSSDGGYSWRFALKGPHHYQIADNGGLLVAVPADTPTPSVIKFSTDEGRCWISYNFTTEPILFTGLLVEPGNRAMIVAIWGYTSQRIWHTHVLNFTALIDKKCETSDYEDWVAHEHNTASGCLLGKMETFMRLKKDSWCYNGKAYEVVKTSTSCVCTADDYDCDYGYTRINDVCVEDASVKDKQINICKRGHEERFVPLGYHKIPGDGCTNGFKPPEAKMIDLDTACGDDTVGPSVEHGDDDSNQDAIIHEKEDHDKQKKAVIVVVILILVGVVVTGVLLTVYGRKYRARYLSYRYLSIRADGEQGLLNKSGASTSLYEDSSDEEVPGIEVADGRTTSTQSTNTNGHAANGKTMTSNWSSAIHESDDVCTSVT